MTTATDLTVKKFDKSPALWRSNSAPGNPGQKPWFQVTSRWNAAKTARRVDVTGFYPDVYTDSTTSLTQISSKALMTCSFVVPTDMSVATAQEFAGQMTHLLASGLIVAAIDSGFAPT